MRNSQTQGMKRKRQDHNKVGDDGGDGVNHDDNRDGFDDGKTLRVAKTTRMMGMKTIRSLAIMRMIMVMLSIHSYCVNNYRFCIRARCS